TLAVLFLVAHRLWAARTRPDPLHPTGPTDDLAPRGGGAEERLAALAAAGNLAEAARAQVRAWFAGFGVSPPAPAAEGFRPVPPPPVRADAPWPKRRRFRREVRSLWAFASGGGPERVTPRGWERMRERLLDLARAARDGEWHFTTATED
ncbi:MAG TPA: hypothetical protein VIL46_04825, partial [Gemmataceae bacterium]